MKPFAIILIILVLAAVVGIGWLYFSANLTVTFDTCIATDGVTQVDYFDQLKKQVSAGTFIGNYNGALTGEISDNIIGCLGNLTHS